MSEQLGEARKWEDEKRGACGFYGFHGFGGFGGFTTLGVDRCVCPDCSPFCNQIEFIGVLNVR